MRGNTILPYIKGAHDMVVGILKNTDIQVHFGTSFGSGTAADLGYDYSLNCLGYNFQGPKRFLTEDLAKCLEPKTG